MSWGYVIVGAATLIGSAISSNQSKKAAQGAANDQTAAAQAAIDEQNKQFEASKKIMDPYVAAGNEAMKRQQALNGSLGPEAQQAAIREIEQGSQFQAMTKQGENAILQNASATGGLRGGNVQATLSQFRPQLLSQLIDQQYAKLGQISAMGQASSTGQAAQGMQQGQLIGNLQTQQGQALAGGVLGQGTANANLGGSISGLATTYLGMLAAKNQTGTTQTTNLNPWGGQLYGSANGGTERVF